MKMKKYYIYLLLATTILGLVGCSKDFLERPPLDKLTTASFYSTDAEMEASTGALYNAVWSGSNGATFTAFGDARGGNYYSPYNADWLQFSRFSISNTNAALKESWASFYAVVSQTNVLISNIKQYTKPAVSLTAKTTALAEARFMRAVAYYYLVQNWGPVPIITESLKQGADTTISRNTVESVWKFIIRDMQYAVKNLPVATPVKSGRLNKYSAEGMLARFYLTYAGLDPNLIDVRQGFTKHTRNQVYLDSAKYYANDVITNSTYALVPNYPDLFFTANNNNSEQLFGLLWVPLGYGVPGQNTYVGNGFQSQFAGDPAITGTGDGWGGGAGASIDYILNLNPLDSIRRKATFMFPGDFYPEITKKEGGWREPLKLSDWNNPVHFKKYIVGTPDDNDGKGQKQGTGNNTYMQRLADVYFIYAEAIMGNNTSTNDPEALKYYNKVRVRAGLASVSSFTFDDLLHERRYEFAVEGDYWYDMLRLYYYNPNKAMEIISSHRKGGYKITIKPGTSGGNGKVKEYLLSNLSSVSFPVNAGTMFLPYPDTELALAPNLRKPPVPYVFE